MFQSSRRIFFALEYKRPSLLPSMVSTAYVDASACERGRAVVAFCIQSRLPSAERAPRSGRPKGRWGKYGETIGWPLSMRPSVLSHPEIPVSVVLYGMGHWNATLPETPIDRHEDPRDADERHIHHVAQILEWITAFDARPNVYFPRVGQDGVPDSSARHDVQRIDRILTGLRLGEHDDTLRSRVWATEDDR